MRPVHVGSRVTERLKVKNLYSLGVKESCLQ
jgi:hypothetical protein